MVKERERESGGGVGGGGSVGRERGGGGGGGGGEKMRVTAVTPLHVCAVEPFPNLDTRLRIMYAVTSIQRL